MVYRSPKNLQIRGLWIARIHCRRIMIRGKWPNRELTSNPAVKKKKIMSVNNTIGWSKEREHNYPGQNQSGRHVRIEDDSRSLLGRPSGWIVFVRLAHPCPRIASDVCHLLRDGWAATNPNQCSAPLVIVVRCRLTVAFPLKNDWCMRGWQWKCDR